MDMDMGMTVGMLINREYARVLWYTVASAVGLYALSNIHAHILCWSRLRNAERARKDMMTRPSWLGLYTPIAFFTATLRECTYPQFLIFSRYTIFNPPPIGNICVTVLYVALILILLFHNSIVSGPMYYETIAFRAAWCSVAQVPLIFLLAMKSSIVGFLVGSSHERLNWLHRTVARCLLLTVTIHMSFFWREWWIYHVIESEIQMMPMVKYGLGAWSILIWIVISSFAPIRNLRYEAFVIQHIISFVTFVTLLLLHVPSYAKVYIWIAVGFYAFDRTVRTLRVLYRNLSILHRRSSSSWLCKAHITALPGQTTRITIKNPPIAPWSPGQHVFLSFPAISPLQSHPFTVSSSPLSRPLELSFVVRAHAGFSRWLYNKATTSLPTNSRPTQFSVILDGPYGRPPNVLQYDTVVLIAGSTGASFTVPILLHALQSSKPNCIRRIQFVWVVKSGSNFEWFADEIMEADNLAADRGIQLDLLCCVTCDPTYTANFPVRIRALDKCSCTDNSVPPTALFTIGAPDDKSVDHERADSISSSTEFSSTRDLCQCHCTGSPHPIRASTGRPDIRAVLVQGLELAEGETGVAVCGPEGLMSRTRCLVAELSDERAADKGSGAYGVAMFAEGFGW